MFILWNPLNFLDGEGQWLTSELLIVCLALIFSKLLRPLTPLIWYLAALHSFDLVTDQLLSVYLPFLWIGLHVLGVIVFLYRFLILKKQIKGN